MTEHLSNLKKNRLVTKQRKKKKQLMRKLGIKKMSKSPVAVSKKDNDLLQDLIDNPVVEPDSESVTIWAEGQGLLMMLDELIKQYESMIVAANHAMSICPDLDHVELIGAISVMATDIVTIRRRWVAIASVFKGKSGSVAIDDITEYFTNYDLIISLHNDTNVVLTEPGVKLTEAITKMGI